MIGNVPDVKKLVAGSLRIDMREKAVDERLSNYVIAVDKMVEEHRLGAMVGKAPAIDEQGVRRMKLRCKLMNHLEPAVLREDMERLSEVTHGEVLYDDVKL